MNSTIEHIKLKILTSKKSIFFGSILCNTDITFSEDIPTACTDGSVIRINKDYFNSLNQEEQFGVVMHELWHIARLHCVDIKDKNSIFWNIACDAVINSALRRDGIKLPKDVYYIDSIYDDDIDRTEEEIYKYICKDTIKVKVNFIPDIKEAENGDKVIQKVHQAAITASSFGSSKNDIPEQILVILNKKLKPKVNWRKLLQKYLTDTMDDEVTWLKRNRRYQDIYLPGKKPEEGRLEHLAYFIDASGSISNKDIERFTSEVFYIYKNIKPRKMTVIQFDSAIRKVDIINENDTFNLSEIHGRGGTSYTDVRNWIIKNKPTCSIIFTDLEARPMEPVKEQVIWTVINNNSGFAGFGKTIHIED